MAHGFLSGENGPILMEGQQTTADQAQEGSNPVQLLMMFLTHAMRFLSGASEEQDRLRRLREEE